MCSRNLPSSMDSQSQREKKRIARIGVKSAENVDDGLDFMSKIIKDMDSQMLHSNAIDSLYRTQDEIFNKDPTLSIEQVSAGSSIRGSQRIKVPKPPKKLLPEKKHPLMEKCQRNLKYLKHNRSIPKQRAHVGYIPKSPIVNNSEKQNKFFPKEKKCSKLEKERNTYHQRCNKEKAISDYLDTKEIAVDNDSDADFENFIREVKEKKLESDETDSDSYKTSKNQKKRKKRRSANKRKILKSTKNKIASKCKNTSLVTDIRNSGFERLNNHFPTSSGLSLLEKLEDSDSDDAANIILDSDQLSLTESEAPITLNHKNKSKEIAFTDCSETENSMNVLPLTFNLHSEEFKKYIEEHFTCSVRIKRDPVLDKRVKSVTTCDHSISTMIRTSESIERCDVSDQVNDDPEIIVLENSTDSDDDCQIIYEAPKPKIKPADTVVRLNEENWTKSLNLPISSSHLPISMCNKLPTETSNNCFTDDGNSEFNIQIMTVQSLSDPNNSTSVDTFQNNTNVNLNNSSPFNSTSNACGQNREISKVNEEIQSSTSKVLIPNLDELLSKINFDLVKKICSQSNSSVDNENYGSCIDKRLDTAVPNDTGSQICSEENPLSEKCLKTGIKRKTSSYELKTDVLRSNWKENCDSNALNAVYDTNYNISPDLINNDISGVNVRHICKTGNKIDFKEASIGNASGKINLCTSGTTYTENLLQCDFKKKFHQPSDIAEKDLKFDLSKQSSQQILKDTVELSACDQNYMNHSSRVIKCDTLSDTQTIPTFACESKINYVNQNHSTCINSVLLDRSTNLPMNSHSENESKVYEVNLHKRKKLYQNVSDELDMIAMTNIRELCEQKHDLSPLLNLYDKALKQYDKIVSAEMNVYTGLKDLEEDQIKRIKHIEAAIRNLVHHDPCFREVKEEYLEKQCMLNNKSHSVDKNDCEVQHQESTLCGTSKISNEDVNLKNAYQVNKKQQVWKCDNCGKEAKFRCQKCLKVFYCSSECGIQYWENVHNVDCS